MTKSKVLAGTGAALVFILLIVIVTAISPAANTLTAQFVEPLPEAPTTPTLLPTQQQRLIYGCLHQSGSIPWASLGIIPISCPDQYFPVVISSGSGSIFSPALEGQLQFQQLQTQTQQVPANSICIYQYNPQTQGIQTVECANLITGAGQ